MAGKDACKKTSDPHRQKHFNDSQTYLPVIDMGTSRVLKCPNCGAEPGPPICPECHSLLPAEYGPDSSLIGLVGVRNSGKTVLLSVLDHELQHAVADRFEATIDVPGGATGLARDLRLYYQLMIEHGGSLPEQTAESGGTKKPPAVYAWRYNRRGALGIQRTASTVFSFYDNAGEDFATADNALSQLYLGATSGVILLLDPFEFPENRGASSRRQYEPSIATTPEEVLESITLVLRNAGNVKRNKKIRRPMAVVISKIDAFFDQIPPDHPLRQRSSERAVFDEVESETVHDHVAALIKLWGGGSLIRKLDQNYSKYRLFGLSALGAEPDYEAAKVNGRGVLPHRVAEPLLWLMATRGFIPVEGAS